jgi:predicted GIY-YIG superfamily endonuclease
MVSFVILLKEFYIGAFFFLLLHRSNRKGIVEQIRQNQYCGDNNSNLSSNMGNLGNILPPNDQDKEHLNKIRKRKTFFVPITYHGHETILMTNKIKAMIERIYPMTNVIFGYRKGLSLSKLFTRNYKGVDPMNIAVIYKLTCIKCEKVYIGQTQFDVNHRINQHKNGLKEEGKSSAADHVLHNKDHGINFDRPEILARDNNKKAREIKKTLLTLKHSNAYNTISHELVIFE